MELRALETGDLEAARAIWNAIIRDTNITFTDIERTPESMADWLVSGGPRLGAFEGGRLLGFASASQFRPGPGYRYTFEHSVHLAPEARGKGAGRALMEALYAALRSYGAHSLIGAITGDNHVSLAFHARLGFVEVGRMAEAGWKFGQWHELVLVEKRL